MVDLELGLRHGCHHSLLDIRVAKAGGGGLRRCEDQVYTMSLDTEAEQRLHSGEDIDAVSVDNSVIWRDTRKKHLGECFYCIVQEKTLMSSKYVYSETHCSIEENSLEFNLWVINVT